MPKRREEVKTVRLSITVDEATWRKLRDAAELERESRGRASPVQGETHATRKGLRRIDLPDSTASAPVSNLGHAPCGRSAAVTPRLSRHP